MYVYSTAIRRVSNVKTRDSRPTTRTNPLTEHHCSPTQRNLAAPSSEWTFLFPFCAPRRPGTREPHRRALDTRATDGDDDARDGAARVVSFLSHARRSTRASTTRRATPERAGHRLAGRRDVVAAAHTSRARRSPHTAAGTMGATWAATTPTSRPSRTLAPCEPDYSSRSRWNPRTFTFGRVTRRISTRRTSGAVASETSPSVHARRITAALTLIIAFSLRVRRRLGHSST